MAERNLAPVEGAEVDDPTVEDEDLPELKPAPRTRRTTAKPEEDEADDTDESEEEAPDPDEDGEPEPPEKPPVKNQAELDRILQDRLARQARQLEARYKAEMDAKEAEVKALRDLQAATGLTPAALAEQHRNAAIQRLVDEHGMEESAARRIVTAEEENRKSQFERQQREHQTQIAQWMSGYEVEKAKLAASDPYAKQFAAEIDEFCLKGANLIPFEVGLTHIIGQKVRSGELLQQTRRSAEQTAIRNMERRERVQPVGNQTAATQQATLSQAQREMATRLGISPKAYAKQLAAIRKERGR